MIFAVQYTKFGMMEEMFRPRILCTFTDYVFIYFNRCFRPYSEIFHLYVSRQQHCGGRTPGSAREKQATVRKLLGDLPTYSHGGLLVAWEITRSLHYSRTLTN